MPISYFRNLCAMMRKPWYGNVPIFPAGQDLSWIPDGGSDLPTEVPVEVPDGVIVTFTFTSVVKYLVWNGQWLRPTRDFTILGTTATMPVAPGVGDELYAVI